MKLDNMFKKTRIAVGRRIILHLPENRKYRKDYFANVINVEEQSLTDDVKKGSYICPKCGGYFRIPACDRGIEMVTDAGTFEEWDSILRRKIRWNIRDTKKN